MRFTTAFESHKRPVAFTRVLSGPQNMPMVSSQNFKLFGISQQTGAPRSYYRHVCTYILRVSIVTTKSGIMVIFPAILQNAARINWHHQLSR